MATLDDFTQLQATKNKAVEILNYTLTKVMTKLIVNNRTDAWKTVVNLFFTINDRM